MKLFKLSSPLGIPGRRKFLEKVSLPCAGVCWIFIRSNFEIPLRLDLDDDTVLAIHGYDPITAQNIDEHTIVLVLPFKTSSKSVFSSDVPLNNFVDIQQGDYVVHNHHGIGRFIGIKEFDIDSPPKRTSGH